MADTPLNPDALEAAARVANLEGWTCFEGGDEPGNYDECADCRRHCRELATAIVSAYLAVAQPAAQPQVEGGDVEREAAVITALAHELDEIRHGHDIAECAAPVQGEVGRQACIDKWIKITEEPAEWLREKAAEHSTQGFEYLRYIAHEAWRAGYESGCEDMENGGHATTNPYADDTPEES